MAASNLNQSYINIVEFACKNRLLLLHVTAGILLKYVCKKIEDIGNGLCIFFV